MIIFSIDSIVINIEKKVYEGGRYDPLVFFLLFPVKFKFTLKLLGDKFL